MHRPRNISTPSSSYARAFPLYKDTGETMDTFAIVTAPANELMTEIHNTKKRMPTIFTEDQAYQWLFGNLSEERIKELASTKFERKYMEAHTIAKDFRTALNPMGPFEYSELPPITP